MTKLTKEYIEAQIDHEDYTLLSCTTTTICNLRLRNNFVVTGTSSCLNASDFDEDLGRKFAREQAVAKIYEFEAYRIKCQERTEVLKPMAKHIYNAVLNLDEDKMPLIYETYGINEGDLTEAIEIELKK